MMNETEGSESSVVTEISSRRAERFFFTPRRWAVWLAERSGLVFNWLNGASVLDPTCGRGDLLLGMMHAAIQRGVERSALPAHRLFGIERDAKLLRMLIRDCRFEFGIEFPRDNLHATDFLLDPPCLRVNAIIGNPPWANFTDLPDAEKQILKPEFTRFGLAPIGRQLLLGGSRVDIAALVVARAMSDHLQPRGSAAFFLPLSLLTGDGAHAGFRKYRCGSAAFALTQVDDFDGIPAFSGVSTRYGAMFFSRDASPEWPVPWHICRNGEWIRQWAAPLDSADSALAKAADRHSLQRLQNRPRISLSPGRRPRQGVNPCGASKVFFVRDVELISGPNAIAVSALSGRTILPRRWLYPLLTAEQFCDPRAEPRRWVLLPHDRITGQPLTAEQLAEEPELTDYLNQHRSLLEQRRGSWLRQWIDRGRWWALLGVGPYCFTPYRVAWPAYGATRFHPKVFAAPWQGQQALHAHIPCDSHAEAKRLAAALSESRVEEYLQAFGTAGTRNFAQPGRVAKLLVDQTNSQVMI